MSLLRSFHEMFFNVFCVSINLTNSLIIKSSFYLFAEEDIGTFRVYGSSYPLMLTQPEGLRNLNVLGIRSFFQSKLIFVI